MLKNKLILLLFFLTFLLAPIPAYAHDPDGMIRSIGTALIIAVIFAAFFSKFLNKLISRRTDWKSRTSNIAWVFVGILIFGMCTILFFLPTIYIVEVVADYYYSDFYLRYGFITSLIIATVFCIFAIKFALNKTKEKNITTRIAWITTAVLVSCVVALLVSPQYKVFNKTYTNTLNVKFFDGTIVNIERNRSRPTNILIIPFGKAEKDRYCWNKNNKTYIRETWFYPIINNEFEGTHYWVEIDRWVSDDGLPDYQKPATFRFYRFVNESWKEIEDKDFPKIIAKQNMGHFQVDIDRLEPIDPKNFNFRHSYTGILWVQLATGKKMNIKSFGGSHKYPEEFFSDFTGKYMKNE